MLSFKPTLSLSSFTFIKRLFSSSLLSAIRMVSSASLSLLIFLPALLIPGLCFIQPGISHNETKIMASGPITSWQIDGETVETVADFILWCSKITADGDCNHEIKRRLLLGRKVMTNLDCIIKSRDITLPTKICIVKAMVFPVVTYKCENWTIKKAEHWLMLLSRGIGEDSWESLEQQGDQTSQSERKYSLEGMMLKLKLQYFGHLMQN